MNNTVSTISWMGNDFKITPDQMNEAFAVKDAHFNAMQCTIPFGQELKYMEFVKDFYKNLSLMSKFHLSDGVFGDDQMKPRTVDKVSLLAVRMGKEPEMIEHAVSVDLLEFSHRFNKMLKVTRRIYKIPQSRAWVCTDPITVGCADGIGPTIHNHYYKKLFTFAVVRA